MKSKICYEANCFIDDMNNSLKDFDISKAELSRRTGISVDSISRIARKKQPPTIAQEVSIRDVFKKEYLERHKDN